MVAPCPTERRAADDGAILHLRTHRVPEMVDLRAQRGNRRTRFGAAWRSSRDIPAELYHHLAADPEGKMPCVRGRDRVSRGEAVLDELAQSHYMQLCFGSNFLRHAALHHCCEPTADVS